MPHYISLNSTLVEITDEEYAARQTENLAAETAMLNVRNRETRNELLTASDWTVGSDSPLTTAQKTKWKTYRQTLRDLPASEGWPNVTFPEEPS